MTAEIAVLNKSAVALATDSAVTISAGTQALKIFESADKLFELSKSQPIGIMVYNGMQFLGVPLETIIKSFRQREASFRTVRDAANAFLGHLYEYVDAAPEEEIYSGIVALISPIAEEISQKVEQRVIERVSEGTPPQTREDFDAFIAETMNDVLEFYEGTVEGLGEIDFLPRSDNKAQKEKYRSFTRRAVEEGVSGFVVKHIDRIVEFSLKLLRAQVISNGKTGIVFAGFGEEERFPTLISYEIDGVFEAKIRSIETDCCDIDRNGMRAYVRPFAQKEMVDRFLHGLDDRLRSDITKYCRETIGSIAEGILAGVQFADDADQEELLKLAKQAEDAFIRNLNDTAFMSFEHRSRHEIEDMVEFMPKPELAKMAEALIDLTSIKRKVSQGLETVGGPVDVAVISKSDGFVWVKRKHYFPSELNHRYFCRVGKSDGA
ncbi:hypothetical protein [Thioclava sp. F36-6]|uniref:hypothetical protein n=1 Tax=Thioclava sp. F36-6 TaxID=1915316 RepID=UPI000996214F|nr:hypothetical protein [Thioclava sp. F36-6]OOY31617.1 hypothetical protein BMI88_11105 [Thioclava sp. F36-6]